MMGTRPPSMHSAQPLPEAPLFINYPQHAGDVLLWRALRGIVQGFHIEVGGYRKRLTVYRQTLTKQSISLLKPW